MTIVSAGSVASGGVFTTSFNSDHDSFTITASGGTAAGLVVIQDVNGDFDIVVREMVAATTLTLTTSPTPGSSFTTNIAGISVNGLGEHHHQCARH